MIIPEIHLIFDLIFDLILFNFRFNFHIGTTPLDDALVIGEVSHDSHLFHRLFRDPVTLFHPETTQRPHLHRHIVTEVSANVNLARAALTEDFPPY